MAQNVILFSFENIEIRAFEINGEAWFAASEVAKALGYQRPADAVRTHCKGVGETQTPSAGGLQTIKIIPERDVYRLVMRSKLPSAEQFEEKVVGEILPSIRKTGGYMTCQVLSVCSFLMFCRANISNLLIASAREAICFSKR